MFPSLAAFAANASPVLTYVESREIPTNTTSPYNFTSVSLGAAASDRRVVVVVTGWRDGSTSSVPTSITIAGVSATIHASAAGVSGVTPSLVIASALVPAGTTGNIVVAYPNRQLGCILHVYTLTGYASATPVETDAAQANSATSISVDTNVEDGQVGLVASCQYHNGGTSNATWTNATQEAALVGSDANGTQSVARLASGNLTRTASWSVASRDLCIAAAVWA
jgi:hypothetical protein